MKLEAKLLNGLERLSEVLKSLLWEKAKVYGISPIQIQILLFVANHKNDICNVSYLAKEFNITKATISDAVKILLKKELLKKDLSPIDKRRFNLALTSKGEEIIGNLNDYALPISDSLAGFDKKDLTSLFENISKLIFQLNKVGIIQVQRTCFGCRHYSGDHKNEHYCNLLNEKLRSVEIRLDCNEYEEIVGE